MNSKTIGITAAVFLVLGGLLVWGRTNQASAPSQPLSEQSSLVSMERSYDFGTISMAGGLVNKVFTITNPTDRDILLTSISTSCMCTTAFIEDGTSEKGPFGMPGHGGPSVPADLLLKAGESRQIKVVYDPNAHGPAGVGLVNRSVYLTEEGGGTLMLEIKANITP